MESTGFRPSDEFADAPRPAPGAVLLAGWFVAALGLALAVGAVVIEFLIDDFTAGIVLRVLGGIVGALLFLGGLGITQRMHIARVVTIWILFLAAFVGILVLAAGEYRGLDDALLWGGPVLGILVATVLLGAVLSSGRASRWFQGDGGQFLQYIVGKTATQGLLVVYIAVFAFLVAESSALGRWDLTEDQRFSITEASRRIVRDLEDQIVVKAFFTKDIPEAIVPLQRQVFDILREYEAASNGRFKVQRYDPIESTAAQSAAKSYGVQPQPFRITDTTQQTLRDLYGSLVLLYGDKQSEIINIVSRYPSGFEGLSVLEYEISSRVWQLVHDKPKVGIAGYLKTTPPPPRYMGMPNRARPQPEFEQLKGLLRESFVVEEVDLKTTAPDPKKIPLLLLVRPKELKDVEVFRLDQYLMKGGRVLAFVTQGTIGMDGAPVPGGRGHPRAWTFKAFDTGLDKWFEHHGVRVPKEFALHLGNAPKDAKYEFMENGPLGPGRYGVEVRNWFWPFIKSSDSFDKENPAVQTLKRAFLYWPHPIDVLNHKLDGKKSTDLVKTHDNESWRWSDLNRIDRLQLDAKRDGPERSELRSSAVAVAIEGKFKSYFGRNAVPPSLTDTDKKGGDDETETNGDAPGGGDGDKKDAKDKKKAKGPEVIKESPETLLVVVGNSLFVSDQALSSNKEQSRANTLLALNLVDWLARSRDLIRMRAKHYEKRLLEDPEYKEDLERLNKKAANQEIDRTEYIEAVTKLEESRKESRKSWRWRPVWIPCLFVLFLGAIVWIVRAALRAAPPRFEDPLSPSAAEK